MGEFLTAGINVLHTVLPFPTTAFSEEKRRDFLLPRASAIFSKPQVEGRSCSELW